MLLHVYLLIFFQEVIKEAAFSVIIFFKLRVKILETKVIMWLAEVFVRTLDVQICRTIMSWDAYSSRRLGLLGLLASASELGFPFAKLLRIFLWTKRKICLLLRISFAPILRNHSQKSFCAKSPFSAFSQLEFCAILQFPYNHKVYFLKLKGF